MSFADLNDVTDAMDALARATSPDEAWVKADAYVRAAGANALNVAEIERGSGAIRWLRSSMKSAWLQDYMAQDFMAIDGLLLAARQGRPFSRMRDGQLPGCASDRPNARSLQDQLVKWEYRTLDSYAMATANAETTMLVTLSRPRDVPEPIPGERLLAAVMGTMIGPPRSSKSLGATPFQTPDLSTRERDVLCYLAAGLRNDMIAWKVGIAEVTVRTHVASARRKLGAATREQAIAIALRAGLLSL